MIRKAISKHKTIRGKPDRNRIKTIGKAVDHTIHGLIQMTQTAS